MTLTGGKRKVNKSFKAWVAFVKRVQKEEKLSYKDAIHRAKVRKDKGEKWMVGGKGDEVPEDRDATLTDDATIEGDATIELDETVEGETPPMEGGRRKTRRRRGSAKKSRKTKRRRTRRH
jgi:hypothetical protein